MAFCLDKEFADGAAGGEGVVHCDQIGKGGVFEGHGHVVYGFEGADLDRWCGGDVEVIKWFDSVVGIFFVLEF
jgi:hypothetical protein